MDAPHFWKFDSTLCVSNSPTQKDKHGDWVPDWTGHARLLRVLKSIGFTIGPDTTGTSWRYKSLRKFHRLAQRGDLFCAIEIYPVGSKFAFFQEIVVENRNGGRYDFGRVAMMPYLVRKSFERAVAALKADLAERGYVDTSKTASPARDPLRFFNETWDGTFEKLHGTHRFKRDETGWPAVEELGRYNVYDRDGAMLTQGAVRYARDRKGYLMRGRVYGGINGMWMFIYGPGERDCTHVHCRDLFSCSPASVPRKQFIDPAKGRKDAAQRVRQRMAEAVKQEDFEVAARLRDKARKIEAQAVAA